MDRHLRENVRLAKLVWASERLHRTISWSGVLEAIEDVAVTGLAAERVLVYESLGPHPQLIDTYGFHGDLDQFLPSAEMHTRAVVSSGVTFVDAGGDEDAPTAVVPLRAAGAVVGAVALLGLRPPKRTLDRVDRELLELMSSQGGVVLLCATLASRRPTMPVPREERS